MEISAEVLPQSGILQQAPGLFDQPGLIFAATDLVSVVDPVL